MMGSEQGFTPIAFYEYLADARRKLLDWVRPLTLEQYTKEFPFGKKTIRDTLVEIPRAEWSYGTRLIGETPPAEHPFMKYYKTDFAPLEGVWRELAARTQGILREERDWSRMIEWRPPAGVVSTRPVIMRASAGGIAIQMMLHEVHHRAQVMAMLRQLGIPAENLDYSILEFERREVPA